MPVLAILMLLGGLASTLAADFNTTLELELDVQSSMIDFLGTNDWKYNETSQNFDKVNASGSAFLWLMFVGSGYYTTGDVKTIPGYNWTDPNRPYLVPHYATNTNPTISSDLTVDSPADSWGNMSDLKLGAYAVQVEFTPEIVSAHVRSFTVEIPVRTQASTFDDMQTHYATIRSPGMDRDAVNPGFVIGTYESDDLFPETPRPDFPVNKSFVANDYGIVMDGWTEVKYKVPANTTLVHLLHDVGPNRSCYVVARPPPSWWDFGLEYPRGEGAKPFAASNQTMQLLPLDPEVEYELAIGSATKDLTCDFSGVLSYSFFANGFGSNSDTGKGGSGLTSDAGKGRGPNIGAIVGGVVGGVGGAALLIIMAWVFMRRRYRKHERVPDADIIDDTTGELPEPHLITQYMIQPTPTSQATDGSETAMSSAKSPDSLHIGGLSPPGQPAVVHAQDAEDVERGQLEPTILPPLYNEAWGERQANDALQGDNGRAEAGESTIPIRAHDALKKV